MSWHLSGAWLGATARQDNFAADADLPSGWYQVKATDYVGSGFDRGLSALAPTAPVRWRTTRPRQHDAPGAEQQLVDLGQPGELLSLAGGRGQRAVHHLRLLRARGHRQLGMPAPPLEVMSTLPHLISMRPSRRLRRERRRAWVLVALGVLVGVAVDVWW